MDLIQRTLNNIIYLKAEKLFLIFAITLAFSRVNRSLDHFVVEGARDGDVLLQPLVIVEIVCDKIRGYLKCVDNVMWSIKFFIESEKIFSEHLLY